MTAAPELRPRGPARTLTVTLVCFAVLAAAVMSLTPAWESNDEPDHVLNIETLAGGHWYRIAPGSGFESHQAPLYYLLMAAYQKVARLPVEAPHQIVGPIADNQQHGIFLHDIPQDGHDQRRVDLLRLPNIIFGLLAILLTYAGASFASRDPWTPAVAAALVAGVPRFVFLSSVVNNDNLSDLLGAGAVALAVALMAARPVSARRRLAGAAALGAVAGLLVLTKLTNIMVAPGLMLAALVLAPGRSERVRLGTAFAACALAVCGWWFVQNQVRYGDPLAAHASRAHLKALFPPLFEISGPLRRVFVEIPQGIYKSFWYVSGYNQFSWRWFWYLPFWALAALGMLGLLWRGRPRVAAMPVVAVLAAISAGALAIVWILGLETSTEQARVAFVGLPAMAILVALGYERWGLPAWARFALPVLGLIGTIAAVRYHLVIDYS